MILMKKNREFGIFTPGKVLSATLRIIIPLYSTYLLFVLGIFLVFLPMLEKHMMDQKKETIRELTDSTLSLLAEYDHRVKQGELTLKTAHQEAINQIRNLKYGPEGKDYFWITDLHPKMIMHPYIPKLEGKHLDDFTDPKGKFLFVEMVKKVEKQGAGYVDYYWQWKDTPRQIVPKISYVKKFSPWGWILGTGIYVDDIHQNIVLITQKFISLFIVILVIIIFMSSYITLQVIRMERKREQAEKAKHFEELRLEKLLELSQMSGASLEELTDFALEEAVKLTQSKIGYLAFLNDDETQLTLYSWSKHAMEQCEVVDKKLTYDVAKTGLWVDSIRQRRVQILNDYQESDSPAKQGYPKGHMEIERLLNLPVFDGEKIVAIAGVANKQDDYNQSDVRQLELMMDGMWKIIQRKQYEDDLRSSEKRYRLLADNASDNIWILDLSTFSFSYISPSVEWILGYTPKEMLGEKIDRYIAPEFIKKISETIFEELEQEGKKGIDKNRSQVIELQQIKKDGSKIWTEVTASFLRDKKGKPDRILGITREITLRKNLEQKLLQSQKMEALGTLAGGIAHDFNNILSSVLGFTELAKLGAGNDEELKSNLDQVLASGVRAWDLVKHILTFSRRADVQKDLIPITPLVKECLKFLRASIPINVEIKHCLAKQEFIVLADPSQILQVLMNLFTNAIYAMEENGGLLDVSMQSINIKADPFFLKQELGAGAYIELIITDTGCGIQKEVRSRIFEPFFTTKERGKGTGMGLSIAYGIIKDLGGKISVDSEPGVGTTFRIILPIQEAQCAMGETSENLSSFTGRGRILLVDDEAGIVEWSSKVLLKLGYDVIGGTDSQETLEKFKQDPNGFDLVLTDLSMPRMNGLELARKMIDIRPDIPIILSTGFSEELTSKKLEANGIFDILMKPVITSELARVVAQAIQKNIS
jgi:PAS domain S-box-containing protein